MIETVSVPVDLALDKCRYILVFMPNRQFSVLMVDRDVDEGLVPYGGVLPNDRILCEDDNTLKFKRVVGLHDVSAAFTMPDCVACLLLSILEGEPSTGPLPYYAFQAITGLYCILLTSGRIMTGAGLVFPGTPNEAVIFPSVLANFMDTQMKKLGPNLGPILSSLEE